MKTVYKVLLLADAILCVEHISRLSIALPSSNAGNVPAKKEIIKKASSGTDDYGYPLIKGQWLDSLLIGNPSGVSKLNTSANGNFEILRLTSQDGLNVSFLGNRGSTTAIYDGVGIYTNNTGYKYIVKDNLTLSNGNIFFGNTSSGKNNKDLILKFTVPMQVSAIIDGLYSVGIAYTSPAITYAGGYHGYLTGFGYRGFYVNESNNYDHWLALFKAYGTKTDVNNQGKTYRYTLPVNFHIVDFTNGDYIYFPSSSTGKYMDDIVAGNPSTIDGRTEINVCYHYGAINKDYYLMSQTIAPETLLYYPYTTDHVCIVSSVKSVANYDYIRSAGADLGTEIKDLAAKYGYPSGYADGQNNPTFKSFIISSMTACQAFFDLPVMGSSITVGVLIGSFVGIGALALLLKAFRG